MGTHDALVFLTGLLLGFSVTFIRKSKSFLQLQLEHEKTKLEEDTLNFCDSVNKDLKDALSGPKEEFHSKVSEARRKIEIRINQILD